MTELTHQLDRNDIQFDEDLPPTVIGIPVLRARGSHCETEFVPAEAASQRPRWVTALLFGALFGVMLGLALSAPPP